MSRILRALPFAALGAALLASAPAGAVGECFEPDDDRVCVVVLEGETYVCGSAQVDPSENMTDDVTGGYACVADVGAGPQLFSCFYSGRRPWLCTR